MSVGGLTIENKYYNTVGVVGDKYDQKLIFSNSKLLLTLETIAKLKQNFLLRSLKVFDRIIF